MRACPMDFLKKDILKLGLVAMGISARGISACNCRAHSLSRFGDTTYWEIRQLNKMVRGKAYSLLFFREDLAPEQVSPDKLVPVPYA